MSMIYVIDDDDQLRTSFHKLLTEEGYDVAEASSGEKGLIMVREKVPDLVILDVNMPGKTGLEVLKETRQIDDRR